MTTVVQSSNSVSSTYLSTLDHLPCDIVRSLWVVQSCNMRAEKEKLKLHHVFQKHPYQQLSPQEDGVAIYPSSRKCIAWARNESVAELESLYAQLKSHHATLKDNLDQLESDISTKPQDSVSQETLRQQLKEHYEKNPLTSRVEALQERVLKESGKVIIKRAQGGATGIRIILNLKKGDPARSIKGPSVHKKSLKKRGGSRKGLKSQVSRSPRKTRDAAREIEAARVEIEAADEPPASVPVEPEVERYCFCQQPSFGNMIGCDNDKCKNGEWFHYKCVGLLNRVDALKYSKQKWYCSSECKEAAEAKKARKKRRKGNKW